MGMFMKILITGHKGFVGKYFCEYYKDHDITGIDIVEGNDARDFFKKNEEYYDLVIHLAAVVGGRATIEGSPLSVAVDLSIDSELFGWALRTRPGRIVYFSSSAAYPIEYQYRNSKHKLKESDIDLNNIKNPDLTYGWSKLTGEYLAQFAEADGIKVNVFRPFSGYGTDQDLSYPFPSFIDRAKNKLDPFQIWGDGQQVRDFIHIKDIVAAVDEAIKQDIQGAVNLGWGRGTSFNELAQIATKFAKYSPNIEHLETKPTGVYYRVCNPDKMISFYRPQISLEEGVRMALRNIR
jgi:nucleoside-diphosphate-sugar epimerase